MSRSGYIDNCFDSQEDQWAFIRYRGAVNSAIRGKKGQAFIAELKAALDALPEKRLCTDQLQNESGECCAIGSVFLARGNIDEFRDVYDNHEKLAEALGIAPALVREVVFENDECSDIFLDTPEGRWDYMKRWADDNTKK